ncbi:transcriptional regulator [Gluconobacter thailandicus F149-1 = NBRC 100600]|uniref:TetR/AcrR family transcriptional regulator n=3 Tax=Gluconobacter thailandicus TaxID=257438 RepID=A0AAP9ET99_GLUTH|nr:TetR/AcrR family transcriptional regulator [Gluconobacter thailandicus]GAN93893.1 transcriptional regulator [Gluconobacter thailandicus F149-1 = NBRC 100600]GBR60392.1 transcriptional regulator [Gluconobacter thailandicus F149-1 = NBRC 100600]GEL88443.1 TetR family transcriptional regulator [Gluconobacter thailandicus F149-1 = NBRC 100600]
MDEALSDSLPGFFARTRLEVSDGNRSMTMTDFLATASSGRRTQQERSDTMRALLLQATIELLYERGYSRLTTLDVAKYAQVSRGALTHHFAHKEDLVVEAISWQLRSASDELEEFVANIEAGPLDTDRIIDHLWEMLSDRLFHITMEYLPEARNNTPFRERLMPVAAVFHAALDRIWLHLSRTSGLSAERAQTILNATMCLMRGMVAQQILRNDESYYEDLLQYWRDLLRREIAQAATSENIKRKKDR